jgi:hypothetical protein
MPAARDVRLLTLLPARSAVKDMYPHLLLDPTDHYFPLIPTFKISDCAVRCTCVMPLAPSVAGNINVAATSRPKGAQVAISPGHIRLIRHLVADVSDVFQSVQHRTTAIISTDANLADARQPVCICSLHVLPRVGPCARVP